MKHSFKQNVFLQACSVTVIGLFIVPQLMLWRLIGRLKIKNLQLLTTGIKRGNVLVIANHPSNFDPWLIPYLMFPYCINPRRLLWNVPDVTFFPTHWRWLYPLIKCQPITRDKANVQTNSKACIKLVRHLKLAESVLLFPEEGRTYGSHSTGKKVCTKNHRIMRAIESETVTQLAQLSGCEIIPIYIDAPKLLLPCSSWETIRKIWLGAEISISVGRPFSLNELQKPYPVTLTHRILTA